MAEQVLYQSAYTWIVRECDDIGYPCASGGCLIRKQSLGPDAAERSRHEAGILRRLAGLVGIPRLAAGPAPAETILLEDVGGESLSALLAKGPLEAEDVLAFAEDLAGIVAAMHHRGVLHKDINPSNILVYGANRQLMLIDFDLSSPLVEERPAFTQYTDIVGTLAYIAPEQTGRTGWPVDQRADLYALGATLYELATGGPPFGADPDPLRLTHDHLAQVPVPPCEIDTAVCGDLSDLIMRLLEKDPDLRYQGADGLLHDLRRIRELGVDPAPPPDRDQGCRRPFVLGERDFPERLPPPVRLVGRDQQVAALAGALKDVIAGQSRVVLVSGQAGVGKTALVNALRPMVTEAEGWFLYGKFDRYRSDPDTGAIAQVLQATAGMLLAQPEFDVEALRTRLGLNAGLLAAVEPRLGTLLGVAPEAPTGDPAKVRERLNQIGQTLLMTIGTPERPVVLVLEDLQWADPVTMDLVETVIILGHLHHVLVVGPRS